VQTIVDDLNKKIVGRRIIDVWSDWPKAIRQSDGSLTHAGLTRTNAEKFRKTIKGKKILKIERRAKNLLFYLSDDFLMLVHLKMTGHFLVGKWKVIKSKAREVIVPVEPNDVVGDPYNRFIHLLFYLDPIRSRSPRGSCSTAFGRAASNGVDNGKMLALSDVRKFAKVILGKKDDIENLPEIKELGPEPLDKNFKFIKFIKLIKLEKRKIKQVLMDPKAISGIGNIYSDEILWLAKIHPFKPANKLSEKELKDMWNAMHVILKKALKLRGTSVSDYRDTGGKKGYYAEARLVYQREGEGCGRCGAKIVRVKIGGRSAHFCPVCQRLKS